MRIPRIYQDITLNQGDTIDLDERAFKHLIHVLRLKDGYSLILFNGLGGEFDARLCIESKRKASATIAAFHDVCRESVLDIHLGQCISKGDRFDFVIQKSTELGVKAITPLISKRSQQKLDQEKLAKKHKHWKQVALSATEQCGRTECLHILPAVSIHDWIENDTSASKFILDPHQANPLKSHKIDKSISVLVGPEGGFEEQELAFAKGCGFLSVQLGKRTLRTETAPLAMISALQIIAGDFTL